MLLRTVVFFNVFVVPKQNLAYNLLITWT